MLAGSGCETNVRSKCTSEPVGVGVPELGAPPSDRFVTHQGTAFEHEFLDFAEAERGRKHNHTQ